LRPTDVKHTIGGEAHATLKKECGARLPTPSAEIVVIHAMGRGTINDVIRLYGLTSGSAQSKTVLTDIV